MSEISFAEPVFRFGSFLALAAISSVGLHDDTKRGFNRGELPIRATRTFHCYARDIGFTRGLKLRLTSATRHNEKSRGFTGRGSIISSRITGTTYFVESSRFLAAKSQLTLVQNPSMNFGRRLR